MLLRTTVEEAERLLTEHPTLREANESLGWEYSHTTLNRIFLNDPSVSRVVEADFRRHAGLPSITQEKRGATYYRPCCTKLTKQRVERLGMSVDDIVDFVWRATHEHATPG